MEIASPETPERNRESLVARWLRARTTRDFSAVEDLSAALLRKHPQHTGFRRALARTLVALDRRDDARVHWQSLLDLNPRDIEAAHHLAQRKDRVRAAAEGVRHIAICGVSFCGSTLMDRLLGSLACAANISESHWLTGARLTDGYAPIDFDAPDSAALRYCSLCGPDCQVLSMPFRRDLAADATDWYGKIADRLGTRTLISADKNPPKLVDHDPLMRFDALVLFKSPVQAWMSTLRKLPADRDSAFYLRKCEDYLALWTDRYRTLLDHFAPQGKIVFVHFDTFVQAPREGLQSLCRALDIPFDPDVPEATAVRHAIGGNPGAVAKLYAPRDAIEIAPLARPDCPPEQIRTIENAKAAQDIFARLLAKAEISLSQMVPIF